MRRLIRLAAIPVLVLTIAGCSTGPGKGFNPEGTYLGKILGTINADLEFTISGNNITGTASVNQSSLLRGKPGTTHITLTGTRDGVEIPNTLHATTHIQISLDGGTTWNDIDPNLTFHGKLTEAGGVTGATWQGDYELPQSGQQIGGTWSCLRQASASADVVRP